jgi:DNA mismatch repair ATPase MutS
MFLSVALKGDKMIFFIKKKRIQHLRSVWGKEINKHRNFELISSFHKLSLSHSNNKSFVDERTWDDLDFNLIFSKIDRNVSGIGQQYLYHLLHKYESNENVLKKRFELIAHLKKNRELREAIQLNLFSLSGVSSYFIAYLALSKDIPFTKYYPIFYLCSLLSVISIFLISFKGIFLFVALFILLSNLILNKIFSRKIYKYFTGFSALNSLIASAISISKIKTDIKLDEINFLNQKRDLLLSLKKKIGYLVIDKESLNELVLSFIEYLNMFLLFDIIAYYRSVNTLLKNQNDILKVFESIASLDSSISIASYLEELPFFSNPTFTDSEVISFHNLYHPLIPDAVSNTLENITNSVLITGSNMAGKTTFIKTIGINFILSQSLYISLSKEISFPKVMVKSAIRRNEDLEEGKSYFFVEIELINNFIKLSKERNKFLFLIDEIFRGTNTIERLAASTAVLKYLESNNIVLVTTHDLELQDLLENNFKMFHFSEQVDDNKYYFDYRIKEGPCSSGNAIKLLEIMEYPELIIQEANQITQKLLYDISIKHLISINSNNSYLTSREKEILNCLVQGFTNDEIAEKFHISKRTVENHLRSIKEKLGLNKMVELRKICRNNLHL